MTQYWAKLDNNAYSRVLIPTTAETEKLFSALDFSKPCRIEVKQPRHGKHHRKYWAILGEVASNCETYQNSRELHDAILLRLGMYDPVIVTATDGTKHTSLKMHSISYAQKDQAEFSQFYKQAMHVIAVDLGFDVEELERKAA